MILSFQITVLFFFGYICSGVELLDYTVIIFFLGTSILFSIVAELFYIPNCYRVLLFPTSSPAFVIGGHFCDIHSDRYEIISHCGFYLHYPDNQQHWTFFCVPVGHLYVFFGKMSIQFCPFKNLVFWLFYIELYKLFIY